MKEAVAILLALAVAQLAAERGLAAMTCEEILSTVHPCHEFVTGKQPEPPEACCSGVKKYASAVTSTEEKREACKCLKEAGTKIPDLDFDRVNSLPQKCGTPLPFPITKDMDCSKME